MTPKAKSVRTGYDASSSHQPQISEHTQSDFNQSAVQTRGNSASNDKVDSRDAVQRRAYEIYQQSGCLPGHCEQNWALAEQDLNKQPKRGV